MLVKEYKPKYEQIEAIIIDGSGQFGIPELLSWHTFKNRYGNREILSTKDYDDTKSTSIIIGNGNDCTHFN